MNFLFPIAFGANFFAMTGLMIYMSLIGKSDISADIAIIHAASFALFYSFSANARSLILNKNKTISLDDILSVRLILILPLCITILFLCVFISSIAWIFTILLIIRKGGEWLNEIYLSDSEFNNYKSNAKKYILIECVTFLLILVTAYNENNYFYISIALWSIAPYITSVIFYLKKLNINIFYNIKFNKLMPHVGSTTIIGIGVYIFRLIILSLIDKQTAGDLFSAFAIGGIFGSMFVHAIGPSLIAQNVIEKNIKIRKYLPICFTLVALIGVVFVLITWNKYNVLLFLNKDGLFYGAVGYSLVGGVIMVISQYMRLNLLQKFNDLDIYGPDILINILFISSVPFLYFIFGERILPALFLLSAIINYTIYRFYSISKSGNLFLFISREKLIYLISALILIPIFLQIDSCQQSLCVFINKIYVFDTGGDLFKLPIPISVVACGIGIIIFNNYTKARTALTITLLLFVLMMVSVVVTTNNSISFQQSKMILAIQFVIPILALVLGQLIYNNVIDLKYIGKTFATILIILVPAQLVLSWLDGVLILVPSLYFFSFYQHLQYGSIIIVCAYILSIFVNYEDIKLRKYTYLLMPLIGVYVAASTSRISAILYILGTVIFICYHYIGNKKIIPSIIFIVSIASMACYYIYASKSTNMHQDLYNEKFIVNSDEILGSNNRLIYWEYYYKSITSNSKAFIFGHAKRPDRNKYPSAHNYYLDLIYNYGLIAALPIVYLVIYTLYLAFRYLKYLLKIPSAIGLVVIVMFLIIVDNSLKVGFRQPYPGIFSFFTWGILLSILEDVRNKKILKVRQQN